MDTRVIEFRTSSEFVRRRHEWETLTAMIGMYCEHHHRRGGLCFGCLELSEYAERRLERCVFGDEKPTCSNCVVHCYRDDMRAKMRAIMRWSGPRMMLRHPLMSVLHKLDGLRPALRLPKKAR